MQELGLYDLTPAMCRLDYTMAEAGGAANFAHPRLRRSVLRLRLSEKGIVPIYR